MSLLVELRRDFKSFTFAKGERFTWVPNRKLIYYKQLSTEQDIWSVFHELGHAVLGHHSFETDIALLKMEVEAWQSATKIAKTYGHEIAWQHVEHCLDSYRDWLHARSTCPECKAVSFQVSASTYQCFNCQAIWRVSKSRLCRPHRRQIKQKQPS